MHTSLLTNCDCSYLLTLVELRQYAFSGRKFVPEVLSELAAIRGRAGGLAREGSREEQAAALHSTILRRYVECASDENGRAMVAEQLATPLGPDVGVVGRGDAGAKATAGCLPAAAVVRRAATLLRESRSRGGKGVD